MNHDRWCRANLATAGHGGCAAAGSAVEGTDTDVFGDCLKCRTVVPLCLISEAEESKEDDSADNGLVSWAI